MGGTEILLGMMLSPPSWILLIVGALHISKGNVKNRLMQSLSMGRKFPLKLIVYEERAGGAHIIDSDERARRVKNSKGDEVYHLMNSDEQTKPIPITDVYVSKSRGDKGIAIAKKKGSGFYVPMKIVDNDSVRPVTDDERLFFANGMKKSTQYRADEDFRDKLLRAAPVIAVGIMLVMWGLGWKFIAEANAQMAGSAASAAASMERAAELLVESAANDPTVVVPPTTGRTPGG